MALSGSWGYSNTTSSSASLNNVKPVIINTANDYAVVVDDPGKCVLKNTSSPIDQVEVLTIQASDIQVVNQTDKNMYPPKVQDARVITVKLENKKRMTSSVDDTFCVDLPCSVNVSFRFIKNSNITASDLRGQLQRLLGALQKEPATSGDPAIELLDNFMLMQLNPNNA